MVLYNRWGERRESITSAGRLLYFFIVKKKKMERKREYGREEYLVCVCVRETLDGFIHAVTYPCR